VARLPENVYVEAMTMPGPGFGNPRRRRFRRIPVRTLAPNVVTLLAMCAGLTAIRMAFEGRYTLALAGIVFAAILDGIDGRLARLLKGASRFGAELDSLSDFVCFGVAPALILYFWDLHELKSAGWIAAMVFAICACLRLARFNVMIDDPDKPAWTANFFGVFRQARRHPRAAGNGWAAHRRFGALDRAPGRLSLVPACRGYARLSGLPAIRLAVLSRARTAIARDETGNGIGDRDGSRRRATGHDGLGSTA